MQGWDSRALGITDLKLLYDNLIRYEIELWNDIDVALRAGCDLQLTWFEILRFLDGSGPCRVQDIAEEFAITVGGTSKVVDRIEAAGYCARRAHPNDRRSSLVELTSAGHHVLEQAEIVFERELELRIGAIIDEAAIRTTAATLATLRAHGHVLNRARTSHAGANAARS
ncbi:hypothetical protein A7G45_08845 [Mycolicibacterium llatzerense]|nr:hypothetical protein [Mycolicibacterium llatzerense]